MSKTATFPKVKLEYALLLIALFLAPIIGGHVATDALPMTGGLMQELMGGGALPLGSRMILCLFILVGLAAMGARNRVIQLPNIRIMAALAALVLLLGITPLLSAFRYVAFREWLSWLAYGATLFLVVGSVGRGKTAKAALAVLGAGCTVVALRGIVEYAGVMAEEPTYRIFAGWNNPNALAGVFLLGSLSLIGLGASEKAAARGVAWAAAALNVLGLMLTQSKGGYLAFGVGLVALIAMAALSRVPVRTWGASLLPVIVGVVLALGLGAAASQASKGGQALARITEAGSMAEQSVGFRQNLWKSALSIAQDYPVGTGVGTFRFYSAKPGLTDQTVFAHQTYLQLASEGGWLAMLAFFALAGIWATFMVRGGRNQPPHRVALKAGIFGAAMAFGAHGFIESNLSFFGLGIMFFALAGMGLQMASDATSPEALPQGVRSVAVLMFAILPLLGISTTAAAEMSKSNLLTSLAARDPEASISAAKAMENGLFGDPESIYLYGLYATGTPNERLIAMERAAAQYPIPRVLRGTAMAARDAGDLPKALSYTEMVFRYEPNNLRAWELKRDLQVSSGDLDAAKETARQTIEVEKTIAYQVRAIPEMIPTTTFEARLFLAEYETDEATKARLILEALEGLKRYAEITVPQIKRMTDGGQPDYAGESKEDAQRKLELGRRWLAEWEMIAQRGGESVSGETLTSMREAFVDPF